MASESIKIIYLDDDIIVIDKPAGLLSIPDRFNKFLPDANSILSNEYGEVFTVHRLDKDTGGVMIYARNAESHKNLNEQFEERRVKKNLSCNSCRKITQK